MLADAIDLADMGAAAQQRPRRRLLLRKRNAWRRRDPIGRGTAGEKNEHVVVGTGALRQRQRPLGAGETGFIGNRVARFDHGDALRRPAVAMPGDGNAVQPVLHDERRIMLFGYFR